MKHSKTVVFRSKTQINIAFATSVSGSAFTSLSSTVPGSV